MCHSHEVWPIKNLLENPNPIIIVASLTLNLFNYIEFVEFLREFLECLQEFVESLQELVEPLQSFVEFL